MVLTIISPATVAHVNHTSEAELSLFKDHQFRIVLHGDLLQLLTNTSSFSKNEHNDELLITKLKKMPLAELLKTLTQVKNDIKKNTLIRIDDQRIEINKLIGPRLIEIRSLLKNPVGDRGYPVIYIAHGTIPIDGKIIKIQVPDVFGDIQLTVLKPNKELVSQGQESSAIQITSTTRQSSKLTQGVATALNYGYQGFIHIIPKGLDHILFVLALFLLTAKFSTLLWQVSAFTLAHTISLALGVFGLVNIPTNIVEPIIALSIAFIAIENIYSNKLKKWRVFVVFCFGLLHGLGFAGVLLKLGLAPNQYVISLIAFNVGVEVAQITVLILALLCLYRFQKKPWYRQRIIQPLSIFIALIACYWFIERIV